MRDVKVPQWRQRMLTFHGGAEGFVLHACHQGSSRYLRLQSQHEKQATFKVSHAAGYGEESALPQAPPVALTSSIALRNCALRYEPPSHDSNSLTDAAPVAAGLLIGSMDTRIEPAAPVSLMQHMFLQSMLLSILRTVVGAQCALVDMYAS